MITMGEFETSMSSKGQVVIAKEIHDQLGLRPKQKFLEEAKGNTIVLKPLPTLAALQGSLKRVARKKSVREISRWIDKGWE